MRIGAELPADMLRAMQSHCNQSQCILALIFVAMAPLAAPAQQPTVRVTGKLRDQMGAPVARVLVTLREIPSNTMIQTTTDAFGAFSFPAEAACDAAIASSDHGRLVKVDVAAARLAEPVELVLRPRSEAGMDEMHYSDSSDFVVAGVTDWTAVGGHGSDSTLRTSESLASSTASLPAATASAGGRTAQELSLERALSQDESQGHVDRAQVRAHAALRAHPTATLYRLAEEVHEKGDHPLGAAREFEQAAKLDPSEANEFEWGSELLVHRAIWEAEAVFQHGVELYATSARMQTALGSALFAGARYDEAADRLCKASDLAPAEDTAYVYLGKVQLAAPHALACVEPRLKRHMLLRPQSAEARYLYAMAILKQTAKEPNAPTLTQAQALLTEAIKLNPDCADAYYELGVLAAQREDMVAAIGYYTRAIAADPAMADAYFRLGKIYDREGKRDKAKDLLAMHDKLRQSQAAAAEGQRKAVKQFSFAYADGSPAATKP